MKDEGGYMRFLRYFVFVVTLVSIGDIAFADKSSSDSSSSKPADEFMSPAEVDELIKSIKVDAKAINKSENAKRSAVTSPSKESGILAYKCFPNADTGEKNLKMVIVQFSTGRINGNMGAIITDEEFKWSYGEEDFMFHRPTETLSINGRLKYTCKIADKRVAPNQKNETYESRQNLVNTETTKQPRQKVYINTRGTDNPNGYSMEEVMQKYNHITDFSDYVDKIKMVYTASGKLPNSQSIQAFYYQLDEIAERFEVNQITRAKAMSEAYKAYNETVGEDNRRADEINRQVLQGLQQQRGTIIQVQPTPTPKQEPFQLPMPKQPVNCNGRWIGNQWSTTCY